MSFKTSEKNRKIIKPNKLISKQWVKMDLPYFITVIQHQVKRASQPINNLQFLTNQPHKPILMTKRIIREDLSKDDGFIGAHKLLGTHAHEVAVHPMTLLGHVILTNILDSAVLVGKITLYFQTILDYIIFIRLYLIVIFGE